jgi:glycerol-3-phosphate acyltransferase PlsY
LAGADPRQVGDQNPGATNALKAGGKWVGLLALLLDISKAAAPIGMAYQIYQWRGAEMALIALAPLLGHAYSPFLRFRGGKALATALGVWIGLTLWQVPLVALAGITLWYLLFKNPGWAVLFTLAGMAIFLLLFRPDPFLLYGVLAPQSALLIFKHRHHFLQSPSKRKA